MRNAFNLLLVTMAIFDSTFLFGSILESFRKQFRLVSDLHKLLFPYLLYPFNQVINPCLSPSNGLVQNWSNTKPTVAGIFMINRWNDVKLIVH